jgi:hypothetical protein
MVKPLVSGGSHEEHRDHWKRGIAIIIAALQTEYHLTQGMMRSAACHFICEK